MELLVDAMGDKCPVPVVKAKKALNTMETGTVEIHVDNKTSVDNLASLAKSLKCESRFDTVEKDAEYHVFITKDENSITTGDNGPGEAGSEGTRVVAFSSRYMGSGNDELGGNLIKAFVFSLTQMDTLPDTLLFYNGGAYLTCEDSPALDDLKALADAGVEILTCGTCLKFYDIEDKLAVGSVTNMYVIVEKQLKAGVVVKP